MWTQFCDTVTSYLHLFLSGVHTFERSLQRLSQLTSVELQVSKLSISWDTSRQTPASPTGSPGRDLYPRTRTGPLCESGSLTCSPDRFQSSSLVGPKRYCGFDGKRRQWAGWVGGITHVLHTPTYLCVPSACSCACAAGSLRLLPACHHFHWRRWAELSLMLWNSSLARAVCLHILLPNWSNGRMQHRGALGGGGQCM